MGHVQGISNKVDHHHHDDRRPYHRIDTHLCIPDQRIHPDHIAKTADDGHYSGKPFFEGQRINVIKRLHRAAGNGDHIIDHCQGIQYCQILPRNPQPVKSHAQCHKACKNNIGKTAGKLHGYSEFVKQFLFIPPGIAL